MLFRNDVKAYFIMQYVELEHFGEDPEEIFPTYPKNSIGQSNVDDDQLARTVLEVCSRTQYVPRQSIWCYLGW